MFETESDLLIVEIGNVPTSAQGVRQDIGLEPNGTLRTKLSGRTYSTARPQFNKLKTTLYFEGLWPPAFGGLWHGAKVTIHSIVELPQPQLIGSAPIRPPVPGSLVYLDAYLNEVEEDDPACTHFNFRPILEVFLSPNGWNINRDEYAQVASSDISFTEELPADWLDPDA